MNREFIVYGQGCFVPDEGIYSICRWPTSRQLKKPLPSPPVAVSAEAHGRSGRRRPRVFDGQISLMIRSGGFLVRIFCQWMSGKA